MTVSQLITELQRLQQEHGDAPVTYPQGDDSSPQVIYSISRFTEHFYDWNAESIMQTGTHIHLS